MKILILLLCGVSINIEALVSNNANDIRAHLKEIEDTLDENPQMSQKDYEEYKESIAGILTHLSKINK